MVDARDQREELGDLQHPAGEHLVVVHDVEVVLAGVHLPDRPDAEGARLREGAGAHRGEFEHVDPVPVLAEPGRAERVVVAVQIEARHRAQQRARLQLGVGLAGEDLDVVAERGQLTGQVP